MPPINPTTNSPVPIPQPLISPSGIPSGVIASETQKGIFQTIVDSGRSAVFQNPVGDAIFGMQENMIEMYDIVNNSTCLSGGEKTQITNALGTGGISGLSQQLSLFSTHTQILSGVIAQGTNSTAGLDKIVSVGRSLGNLSSAIEGISDCLSVLNGMTGLFSNELLNGYTSEIAGMIEQINNCLADATAIASRLNEIKNTLESIINADNNWFQDALNRLQEAALSSLVESFYQNPCGKLLLEQIGTQKLLGFLR